MSFVWQLLEEPDSDKYRQILWNFAELQHHSKAQSDKLAEMSQLSFFTHICQLTVLLALLRYEWEERKKKVWQWFINVEKSTYSRPLLISICLINSLLTSSLLIYHHGFHWEIWTGESRKLWGVSGSNWYQDLIFLNHEYHKIHSHWLKISLSNICIWNFTCSQGFPMPRQTKKWWQRYFRMGTTSLGHKASPTGPGPISSPLGRNVNWQQWWAPNSRWVQKKISGLGL